MTQRLKQKFKASIGVFALCAVMGLQADDSDLKLRAPILGINSFEEKEAEGQKPEGHNQRGSKTALGRDYFFRNGAGKEVGSLIQYGELLNLIVERQIEAVTINRDLTIALARPTKDSDVLRGEVLVMLPYWSSQGAPDFTLRYLCESYRVELIIAAENDHFQLIEEIPIYKTLGFWALVISAANFSLLLYLLVKSRNPAGPKS